MAQVLEESRKELLKDDARAPFAQSNIEFRFTEWHDIPEMSQKRTGFNYLTMPKGAKILKGREEGGQGQVGQKGAGTEEEEAHWVKTMHESFDL